ncbi:MAG TPA: response regulator [Nostocaceae cyanobacterium]|nr:response regulator [Nostocaceae cyanobacterium]
MASNKILVIDDTTVVRVKVKEMLEKLPGGNFEVVEAKDGLEGYNLITREKFSLIMLDFLLPKMTGWEVFQKIQAQAELRKIPLVIMSGRKEEVTEKIPEPFEYFDFLGKPFDQKQLVNALKSAMAKAKLPRPDERSVATPAAAAVAAPPAKEAATTSSASAAEIAALNEKIVKMQAEIEGLKKQLTQIVTFIKQKIK